MKYIPYILIGVLLIALCIVGLKSCKRHDPKPTTEIKTVTVTVTEVDTVYIRDTVNISAPAQIGSIPGKVPAFMKPDSNYNTLKIQHQALATNYFATNIFRDTFSRDSNYLILTDSVSENRIIGRKASFQLASRTVKETTTVTNTVTVTPPPRRQVFFGPNVAGNDKYFHSAGAGFIYKDRQQRLLGVSGKYAFQQKEFVGELQYLFLIKLKR